jgi:AhpD family alkylhydroperoxidase
MSAMPSPIDPHRLNWAELEATAPAVIAALRALTLAVDASGLDKALTELLKVRVSQLNGCAFCVQFHLNLARKLGVPAAKLELLAAWRHAGVHSPAEQAALAWAEALTLSASGVADDAAYAALAAHFEPSEVVFLTTAIAGINAWNRLAGGLRLPPPMPVAEPPRA